MASENIKSIDKMRKKNDKSMTGKAGLESKLKHLCQINQKALNKLENILGQVTSLHIRLTGPNNVYHQIKQENAHMMKHFGQFEILQAKIWDEVMTAQSDKKNS